MTRDDDTKGNDGLLLPFENPDYVPGYFSIALFESVGGGNNYLLAII